MLDFVQQPGCARAAVQTWRIQACGQRDGTVFAAPQGLTTAIVVANVIGAFAMDARSVFLAFVDFCVADHTLVADITFAGVRVYLEEEQFRLMEAKKRFAMEWAHGVCPVIREVNIESISSRSKI